MDLIVVRHAVAMDQQEAQSQDIADRDRPLTPKGRKQMKRAARGLVRRVPRIASIITSPLRRAVETGAVLGKVYGGLEHVESAALNPDAEPDALAQVLAESTAGSPVAVVGHEPHLSKWISWALTGQTGTPLELKKGGACLIQFEGAPAAGQGRLMWFVTPGILKRLRA
jgi:phosphohistidine phosphatase